MPTDDPYKTYLLPLCNSWMERIRRAEDAKKDWQETADQCMAFYASTGGYLWKDEFRAKFLGANVDIPKYQICFQKAFELVSIFGPMLYWDNPQRFVKPRSALSLTPEAFGISQQQIQQVQQFQQWQQQGPPPPQQPQPGQPPVPPPQPPPPPDPQIFQAFQIWQWSQQQTQSKELGTNIRCQLQQHWLNYIPGQLPNGGLAAHSRLAVVEALVKGRGCLWTQPHEFPGSQRAIVGSFYDTVDNLFIDPDATNLGDATWIAQRVCAPVWKVEDEFSLTPGTLEGRGQAIANEAEKGMGPVGGGTPRKNRVGRSSELVTYWKIWSRAGIGTKMIGSNLEDALKQKIESLSGQFVFLCLIEDLGYPLNLPGPQLEGMEDDEVRERLQWPFPCWKRDQWPVAVLDFYPHPTKPWPTAPLAPALGELTFLQVVISHMASRIVKSSRDFIAVLKSAEEAIEKAIKNGEDLCVLPIDETHQKIGDVVQFLQQPQVNKDAWEIIDRVTYMFERRTGLSELMAGQTGNSQPESRSATDAAMKRDHLNVRPDDMQRKVEFWQTDVAHLEQFATRWFIEAKDVEALLGPVGAYLWQTYITTQDPELTLSDTECTIEAGSIRKPNRGRDLENVQSLTQFAGPFLQNYTNTTGDTSQFAFLLKQFAEVNDMDLSSMPQLGQQLPPPPPPEVAQQQQQQQQIEVQKGQLELQKIGAEVQAAQQKAQVDMQKAQFDQQFAQAEAANKMQTAKAEMYGDAMKLNMEQQKAQVEGQIDMAKLQTEMQMEEARMQMELQHESQRFEQEMAMSQQRQLMGASADPLGGLLDGGDKPSKGGSRA